jgi:hypothetical protein
VAAGTSDIEEGSEATTVRAVGVTQTRGTSAADAASAGREEAKTFGAGLALKPGTPFFI